MSAVGGIDSELVHHLIVILAPVPQVHKAVVEGGAVVPHECLFLAQALGGGEHIGRDVLLQELSEFVIRERDEIEPLEFWRKLRSSASRSRMSLRYVYFISWSFSRNCCSSCASLWIDC